MFASLTLILPALFPSWRFFETIAPAPRIEFRQRHSLQDDSGHWHAFRPLPARLSFTSLVGNLFYHPRGNESLFLRSCAERLIIHPTNHSAEQIVQRLRSELAKQGSATLPYLQFRLTFVSREGSHLQNHTLFTSPLYPLAEDEAL